MENLIHTSLLTAHPELYSSWINRFPFDDGIMLTTIFLKSDEYYNGATSEINRNERFFKFCQSFWHLVTDQPPHMNSEAFFEVQEFHIHYYNNSTLRLRGPHLKDMRSVVINNNKLKNKLFELKASATQDNPMLVHTSTGDDLYDHTFGALWLGQTLPLDFSKLD